MTTTSRDAELWRQYCVAEQAFVKLRMELVREAADLPALVGEALQRANDRGIALELLLNLPLDASLPHLASLVRLSCIYHRDIVSSRTLVRRLYESGRKKEIVQVVNAVLEGAGGEEFLRVAELYWEMDTALLTEHLQICAKSADLDIREISTDFFPRIATST